MIELALTLFALFVLIIICFIAYFLKRFELQDRYLSNSLRGFASAHNMPKPKVLNSENIEEIELNHYSPSKDPDTVMRGKVVDMFD